MEVDLLRVGVGVGVGVGAGVGVGVGVGVEVDLQPPPPPERPVREDEDGLCFRLGVEDRDLGEIVDEDVVLPAPPG